ncbi:hypothetical protein [Leptotrichia trevisanii]|uniref:hypothetical protein n=1 Tax=Leptotrichia trevisanii TaxID=109328 RepID=UPI0026F323BF|nr:hypothetical protein [Leptotrichia trevisanii]
MKKIKILDCTLRDGGLGLEDANKTGIKTEIFDKNIINKVILSFSQTDLDIIELGSIEITNNDMTKYCIYKSIEDISQKIPLNHSKNQMYVALFRGPDTPIENIPDWNENYCRGIRVIIRYSELQKSLDFCKALSKKGYKVFVQPMLTMRYTDEELDLIIKASNEMEAYVLYFVDSYGYMTEQDVIYFLKKYDGSLNSKIKIGFHSHNNLNLAFSNVKAFINYETNRDIIIDSCVLGMGQGAGNLQTEIIADYLNRYHDKNYNYEMILEICELIEKFSPKPLWGYTVTTLLPALHKVAYKYSINLRERYGLSYIKINYLLKNIPENLRHRYTQENLEKLLNLLKKGE